MKKGTLVTLNKNKLVYVIDDESLNLKNAQIEIQSDTTGVTLGEITKLNKVLVSFKLDKINTFHDSKIKSNLAGIELLSMTNVDDLNIMI